MRKLYLLVILLSLSYTVNAATFQQAWASCSSTMSALVPSTSFSAKYCQTIGQAVKLQRVGAGGGTVVGTVYTHSSYPFTGSQCSTGYEIESDLSSNCLIVCTSPQIRDATTNTCTTPPPPCTAGQTKTLLVLSGTYPTDGTAPTFKLNQDRTAVSEVHTTVNQGGCVYNLPLNPNQNTGCSSSPSGLMYCRVQATQTGTALQGPDTALDAALTTNQTPVPSASPGCYKANGQDEVCPTTTQKNCGVFNGADVCFLDGALSSQGYPATIVDGQVVADKTNVNGQVQNCFVTASGKSVCIELPEISGTGCTGTGLIAAHGKFICLQTEPTTANPVSKTIPVSKDIKDEVKTASVTNPDGSRTETITTTNNVVGTTPTVTTNIYNAAGQQTSTQTIKGDSQGNGHTDGIERAGGTGYTGTGRFYTSTGKTVASVGANFLTNATNSPLLKAGQDIFAVTIPVVTGCANCDLSLPSVMALPSMELRPFCAEWMPAFWVFISAALKVATVAMSLRIMITPTF